MTETRNQSPGDLVPARRANLSRRSASLVARGLSDIRRLAEQNQTLRVAVRANIFEACRQGNTEQVKANLLADPSQVHARDEDGWTPLHWAAFDGHVDVARLLLRAGADSEAGLGAACRRLTGQLPLFPSDVLRDTYAGLSALHLAAWRDHADVAALLVAEGGRVDGPDAAGCTPLHIAALRGCARVAGILLDSGSEVDQRDGASQTALHLAAQSGSYVTVELLVTRGADVDAIDVNGRSPLDYALEEPDAEIVRSLLRWGGPSYASAVLHVAASWQDAALAQQSLEHGANVDARDWSRRTPLHYAVECDDEDIVELLLTWGADVNAVDADGICPLDLADEGSKLISILREHGASR